MPASTLDPVNAALRTALAKNDADKSLDSQLAGATRKALLTNIEYEPAGSYQSTVLDKLKSKYIVLKSAETPQPSKPDQEMGADETLKLAKYELYPLKAVQLGWNGCSWTVGAGMVNMGNTCYLNSTLQALFHVPALVNWLMSDKEHAAVCQESGGLCIICAMRKTLQDSQQCNANSIRPLLIYNKLRSVCRNLIPGRQEDAHEFLRYLVEAMEKAYLSRYNNHLEFDSKIKETTPLNQILGGYLRSAVRCLKCSHISTTFQHFQDLLLDIRKAHTLDEALELYFSREKLDDDSYQCESCQKKVPATKQFSLERAPMVLCIQLKRFSVTNNKIAKHVNFRQRLDLTRYARDRPNVPLIYRLVALVTHMGPTVSCGHYTAVAQAPSGNFYQFDDSMVRPISDQAVFNTNTYMMLYELESTPFAQKTSTSPIKQSPQKSESPGPNKNSSPSCSKTTPINSGSKLVALNGISYTSDKVYGPELPPSKKPMIAAQNGALVTSSATAVTNGNGNGKHASSSDSDSDEPKKPDSSSSINNKENGVAVSGITSSENIKSTSPVKKLVPYETDDSSSSDDSTQSPHEIESRVSTKAAVGEWHVTSSTDDRPSEGKTPDKSKSKASTSAVVNELFKMSHSGYSAPVTSWNGTRAQLDKEVGNERREDRKRPMVDSSDAGRAKHVKTSHVGYKSNPGYNAIQEFHNAKNWSQNSSNGSSHYNNNKFYGGNKRRRNFHKQTSYHKNFRYRQ